MTCNNDVKFGAIFLIHWVKPTIVVQLENSDVSMSPNPFWFMHNYRWVCSRLPTMLCINL